jgi:hypothetical protein
MFVPLEMVKKQGWTRAVVEDYFEGDEWKCAIEELSNCAGQSFQFFSPGTRLALPLGRTL